MPFNIKKTLEKNFLIFGETLDGLGAKPGTDP